MRVFVWVFHRVSGILLIVLMLFQLTTGFYQGSYASSDAIRTMAGTPGDVDLRSVG